MKISELISEIVKGVIISFDWKWGTLRNEKDRAPRESQWKRSFKEVQLERKKDSPAKQRKQFKRW